MTDRLPLRAMLSFSSFAVAATMLCTTATLSAGEKDDNKGWVKLLQGDSFEPHWTTKGNWKLDEEGVATLTPRPGEKGWDRFDAYLWSEKQYDDFEIQFEYKVAERGNSGFYFNVADKANPVQKGIEVQIFDAPAEEGKKLTDHDSGGVIPGIPPTASTAKPAGEWNQFHITVAGDKLTVRLNGETVNKVNLKEQPRLKDRPEKGYIGFQDHSLPLALRNIRIRDLSSR